MTFNLCCQFNKAGATSGSVKSLENIFSALVKNSRINVNCTALCYVTIDGKHYAFCCKAIVIIIICTVFAADASN